ncbi:MAG: LUD domain-containing protein [Verrucomicrobia bacterium]|nr:LUD domain-containing protein [Verrucomicrobiota bacterium]
MSELRRQFEERLGQLGVPVVLPAELEAMLTGKVFVSEHAVCKPWAARATCADPREADVTVTGCDALVAETGSVALLSAPVETRLSTLMAPLNVVVGGERQLVADMELVFEQFAGRLRPGAAAACLTFVTGPSRTTDIEKTLIFGVHGPKKLVFVFAEDGG